MMAIGYLPRPLSDNVGTWRFYHAGDSSEDRRWLVGWPISDPPPRIYYPPRWFIFSPCIVAPLRYPPKQVATRTSIAKGQVRTAVSSDNLAPCTLAPLPMVHQSILHVTTHLPLAQALLRSHLRPLVATRSRCGHIYPSGSIVSVAALAGALPLSLPLPLPLPPLPLG